MESRIEELKRKYWDGTSSLEEEAELKKHFAEQKTLGAEARYFDTLATSKNQLIKASFTHPGMPKRRIWMAVAASLVMGTVAVGLMLRNNEPPEDQFLVEDPKEAYEITRNALMMMSAGLNEGTVATTELNKINKAEELLIKN